MIYYENLKNVNFPFFKEYKEVFDNFINSGRYVLGENVTQFETEFAKVIGTKYCVGVGSGLAALELAIKAFNFPVGSEIIVPSNTYIASILAIVGNNLKPVLVEPDIGTYNIDPRLIEEKITSKTVAVMVVHLYGKSSDMDPIMKLCKKYDLVLIEDCAQSHGAKYKGITTGSFGIGAFSFYPTKNLGALGEAGAITTDDSDLNQTFRKLRNYGSIVQYQNDIVGTNQRLDEIQAALLHIKLRHLDQINNHKRQLAQIYLKNLKEDFIKPVVDKDYFDVYHIFNVRHPKRDQLREYLAKHDIQTGIHYPTPPHRQPAMKGIIKKISFPISEEIHTTTLSLPISYSHTPDEIYKVVEVLNKF